MPQQTVYTFQTTHILQFFRNIEFFTKTMKCFFDKNIRNIYLYKIYQNNDSIVL